jgi:hypothetical protein
MRPVSAPTSAAAAGAGAAASRAGDAGGALLIWPSKHQQRPALWSRRGLLIKAPGDSMPMPDLGAALPAAAGLCCAAPSWLCAGAVRCAAGDRKLLCPVAGDCCCNCRRPGSGDQPSRRFCTPVGLGVPTRQFGLLLPAPVSWPPVAARAAVPPYVGLLFRKCRSKPMPSCISAELTPKAAAACSCS